jgi:hypothetical protein
MSELSWDNFLNDIENTWSYNLLGNLSDNYLGSYDDIEIKECVIRTNNFRKRKHTEQVPSGYTIYFYINRFKYN